MGQFERNRERKKFYLQRAVPAAIGAILLLLNRDSITGVLEVLKWSAPDVLVQSEQLSILIAAAALLTIGWNLELALMIGNRSYRVWPTPIQLLRLAAGIIMTVGCAVLVFSILQARAAFSVLAMSAMVPSPESVSALTSSGKTGMLVGCSFVLLSTALVAASVHLPNSRQFLPAAPRKNGVRAFLLGLVGFLSCGMLLLLVLLYHSNQTLNDLLQGNNVSLADVGRHLNAILRNSQWFFMALATCGLLQAALPFAVTIETPEDDRMAG
jgi:hypothetical protein